MSALSADVLALVMSFLPTANLNEISRVSKEWYRAAHDNTICSAILQRMLFNLDGHPEEPSEFYTRCGAKCVLYTRCPMQVNCAEKYQKLRPQRSTPHRMFVADGIPALEFSKLSTTGIFFDNHPLFQATSGMTIEVWFCGKKWSVNASENCIISNFASGAGWQLQANAKSVQFVITTSDGTETLTCSLPTELRRDKWTRAVVTIEPDNTVRLEVVKDFSTEDPEGGVMEPVTKQLKSGSFTHSQDRMVIGRGAAQNASCVFDGGIFSVRITRAVVPKQMYLPAPQLTK